MLVWRPLPFATCLGTVIASMVSVAYRPVSCWRRWSTAIILSVETDRGKWAYHSKGQDKIIPPGRLDHDEPREYAKTKAYPRHSNECHSTGEVRAASII